MSRTLVKEMQCHHCFGVLADETRVRMIHMLQKESVNVTALTESMGVSQPTISYHLKLLEGLGLIRKEKRGRETYYSFNPDYPCKGCGVFSIPIKL